METLEAGRIPLTCEQQRQEQAELNRRVALEVMGWRYSYDSERKLLTVDGREFFTLYGSYRTAEAAFEAWLEDHFRPATDPGHMMEVVERLHAEGDCLSLDWQTGIYSDNRSKLGWIAKFRVAEVWAVGETAPEAICRAALRALARS